MDLGYEEADVKRTPMRQVSKKRAAERPGRRAAVAEAKRRDGGKCQWPIRLAAYEAEHGPREWRIPRKCYGPITPHEPKGMRNVDREDASEIICACLMHNEAVENISPAEGRLLGFRPENRNGLQ